DAAFDRVEQRGREQVLMLEGHVLVARVLLCDRDRGFGGRHTVDLAVVESVAREETVTAGEAVIDPDLREVLVGGLRAGEQILRGPAAKRPSVRVRKQRVEVRGNGW